jgi:AAA+ ATPase superfamily predicted ATPase
MDFYGRDREIGQIGEWEKLAHKSAQMTVIAGRRRIGKTTLIRRALKEPSIYFFVVKKSEALLCEEFLGLIKGCLGC